MRFRSYCKNCFFSVCYGDHHSSDICRCAHQYVFSLKMFKNRGKCKNFVPNDNLELLEWEYVKSL